MTTGDYALIISVVSMLISLGGLVWNIWSKFIYPKPKLRVSFAVMSMVPDPTDVGHFLDISATNLGPGDVIVQKAVAIPFVAGEYGFALLSPIHNFPLRPFTSIGPFGGGLPKKLAQGESISLYFPFERGCFVAADMRKVGINDSLGRNHWAPGRDLRKVVQQYEEDFGPVTGRQDDHAPEPRRAAGRGSRRRRVP